MKSVRLILLTGWVFLMVASGRAESADPVTLRVLCYNIHYGQGMDGQYDIARLADVIRKTQPDLVALQEVDVGVRRSGRVHQAARLGELTGMSVWYGPTQHYEGGLFGNAVLSRLPVDDVLITPLPYTEATAELKTYPRGAIAVTIRSPDIPQLRFISTHFQHNLEEDRIAEAKEINQLFGDSQLPCILAGDMNSVPGSQPVQILNEKWTNAIGKQAEPTAPSVNPSSRIDYVFYRGDGLRMIQSEVINESMASDHRPVLVILEIAGTP
ncbi:MAG: endonuclease/exonuclease/phosphatase family protein [Planctomycetaceae bacterium]|nr:endonuclease/exonuclease/phosphatase family protein [Planctomycetaceae bacterium]